MGTVKKGWRLFAPIAAICLVNVLALIWGIAPSLATDPPDIVVILTDDMRADDWDVLRQTQRLIGGGRFENFVYTTPLCCPTRATLLTGQYAHNHGIRKNHPGWPEFRSHEPDSLAVALDEAGYYTALFGKYLNGYDNRTVPPGWDDWQADDRQDPDTDNYRWNGNYHTDELRDRVVKLVSDPPSDPLFLYLSFHSPHTPSTPAKRHAGADVGDTISDKDRKRKRTLLAVDEAVVAIAQAMGPRWDTACIVALSDNGYLLGEHGTTGKSHWWDEASRVPLLIRCPGVNPDNRVAGTVDITPTLLRAAGMEAWWPLDGRPLQGDWQRDAILIESWEKSSGKQRRRPFTGLKGDTWLYVEPEGKAPWYYLRSDGERDNRIGDLSAAERGALAARLADLRNCRGAECG